MTKIIIENRTSLSDAMALYLAYQSAVQYEITGSMIEQRIDGVTIHRSKNAIAQTFVVMETERVVA